MNDRKRDAARLLDEAVVWDNHLCMPLRAEDSFLPELERCRASGLDVVSLNVGFGGMDWVEHLNMLTYFRAWLARRPDRYALVRTVADIRAAKAAGKLAVTFDVEGMAPIEDDLDRIQLFYDLGVRWMLIAYNETNKIGGGCQDDDPGLSDIGRQAIDEMARVGMPLCLSHTGYRTAREALEYAKGPVIFSHSNPLALKDHPRNIPDDLIDGCARTGGVIGINGIGKFLGENDASTEAIVRHVDYVAARVGAAHVGLSLDYCFDQEELAEFIKANPDKFPPHLGYGGSFAMAAPEQYPQIAEALLRLGYDERDIKGILGGNWLRIAEQVWR
ncbi:MAG: membrane dipeptidase [Proteobacteria bacterium]|jgi:membrane dipeptidase|nr:MAG: membrane dipeptidase [Pseudomonadota bacterium]